MFDENLLFFNGQTITETTNGAWIDLGKTGAAGVTVELVLRSTGGSETGKTFDVKIQDADDTAAPHDVVSFDQQSAEGRWTRQFQSQRRYARAVATWGAGTGITAEVTLGIVSGPPQDQVA